MKDPGPNAVELLAAILAKTGVAAPSPSPAFGACPVIYPVLWYWKDATVRDFGVDGDGDYDINIESEAEHCLTPEKNIIMKTRETTPTSSDKVWIYKWLPAPRSAYVRLRLSFAFPYTNTGRNYEFYINFYDGARLYNAWTRASCGAPADPIVQYKPDGEPWTSIPSWRWDPLALHWNFIDLCVNFVDKKYHYFAVNNQQSDLNLDGLPSAVNTARPSLELLIRLVNLEAAQHEVYLDHILVTEQKYQGE